MLIIPKIVVQIIYLKPKALQQLAVERCCPWNGMMIKSCCLQSCLFLLYHIHPHDSDTHQTQIQTTHRHRHDSDLDSDSDSDSNSQSPQTEQAMDRGGRKWWIWEVWCIYIHTEILQPMLRPLQVNRTAT